MQKPVRDLQMNFEPPSDFVGESQSGGRRWLKWVGIGCAGISLIIALIMVFGGFKMVSCCSDMVETGKLTIVAEGFAQEFARSIQNKEFESAYAMTSVEQFQSSKTLEQFTVQFTQHEDLLARSMPVVSGFESLPSASLKEPQWKVTMRMLPPDGGEMLVMILKIGTVVSDDKNVDSKLELLDVQIDRRTRDIAAEAPAVAAIEFHDLLRLGDYEGAYKRFGEDFLPGETEVPDKMSEESFKTFIKENEAVFTLPVMQVVRIGYEDGNQARVDLLVGRPEQKPVVVQYQMSRLSAQSYVGWKVVGITPAPEAYEVVEDIEAEDADIEAQE